jgi:hypothetical protein
MEESISVDLFAPRNWEGAILRLHKTADGGAEAVIWSTKVRAWEPFDRADIVVQAPIASDADLRAAGVTAADLAG